MKTPNIDLIQDTILVKQDDRDIEKTEAGLYIPEKIRQNYIGGKVILVGDQVTELKAGDVVIIDKSAVRRTSILSEDFIVVKEQQVFFKLI
jgi:co-chaperonin GroES (HSP10)